MRPLRGLQEPRVATREESGVLGFPEGEGNEGFPPPPDKDLESPSSPGLQVSVEGRPAWSRGGAGGSRAGGGTAGGAGVKEVILVTII